MGATLGAGTTKAVVDTGLKVLEVASDAVSWSWRLGLGAKRRSDQDQAVRDLVRVVNDIVRELKHVYQRGLVLVIDGLDRIQDPARVPLLFVESSLLGELECEQVFTVPPTVFDRTAQEAVAYESRELCNVAVLDPDDPTKPGPDLEFFHSLVSKRLDSIRTVWKDRGASLPIAEPFPPEVIDQLAYYSGGVVREFMRMIVFGAGEAWEAKAPAFDDAIVSEVLRHARGLRESRITKGEIALLKGVMNDPKHELPDGQMARELLREQRLLPYPNDRIWYYPHPLLTRVVLRPGPPSGS